MVALANARMIIGNQAMKYLRYTCLSCSSESAPFCVATVGRSSCPFRLQPLVGVDGPPEAPKPSDHRPSPESRVARSGDQHQPDNGGHKIYPGAEVDAQGDPAKEEPEDEGQPGGLPCSQRSQGVHDPRDLLQHWVLLLRWARCRRGLPTFGSLLDTQQHRPLHHEVWDVDHECVEKSPQGTRVCIQPKTGVESRGSLVEPLEDKLPAGHRRSHIEDERPFRLEDRNDRSFASRVEG